MVNPVGVNNTTIDIHNNKQESQDNSFKQRLEKKIGKTALKILTATAIAVVGFGLFALIQWSIIPAVAMSLAKYGIGKPETMVFVWSIAILLGASPLRDPNNTPSLYLRFPRPHDGGRLIPR